MKKILILGGVSYNTMVHFHQYSDEIRGTLKADEFYETIGSTGAAKAMACNALELSVTLYGIIGDDFYGEIIKSRFKAAHIPFYYDIDPNGTERHVNLMQLSNDTRTSIFLQAPSEDFPFNEKQVEKLIADSDVVFLNVAGYCKRFIPILKKYSSKVWCDLHNYNGGAYYDEFIEIADVILFSSENVENYWYDMKVMHQKEKQLVFCSHGRGGVSVINEEGNRIDMDAITVDNVKDTNGAGDNFLIGVYYAIEQGYTLEDALKIGTVMGRSAVMSNELIHPELSIAFINKELSKHYKVSPKLL